MFLSERTLNTGRLRPRRASPKMNTLSGNALWPFSLDMMHAACVTRCGPITLDALCVGAPCSLDASHTAAVSTVDASRFASQTRPRALFAGRIGSFSCGKTCIVQRGLSRHVTFQDQRRACVPRSTCSVHLCGKPTVASLVHGRSVCSCCDASDAQETPKNIR